MGPRTNEYNVANWQEPASSHQTGKELSKRDPGTRRPYHAAYVFLTAARPAACSPVTGTSSVLTHASPVFYWTFSLLSH
jgi:hypothetical protein